MSIRRYDLRQDGTPPPGEVLCQLTTPGVLRARAAVRLEIAKQDALQGDTWAAWQNNAVAQDMLERAAKGGGE